MDEAALARAIVRGPGGLQVLAGPPTPEDASGLVPGHLQQLLNMLRERFAFVIVTVPSVLHNYTVGVLDVCDDIVLVTAPEYAAVKNTILLLEAVERLNYPHDKIKLVLNQSDAKLEKEMGLAQLADRFRREIISRISARDMAGDNGLVFSSADSTLERYREEYRQMVVKLVPLPLQQQTQRVLGLA